MERRTTKIVAACIALGILLLFLPITQTRVVSYGIDAYNNHKPLFGNRTETISFTTTHRTRAIGSILVDMRRSNAPTDVYVRIAHAQTGEPIAETIIPKESIRDDAFSFANLQDSPIASHTDIRISFSAPDSTSKNPIGMRFETDDVASLAVKERVPIWQAAITIGKNRASDWKHAGIAAGASLLLAIPLIRKKGRTSLWLAMLALAVVAGLGTRFWTISQFGGVSGGDAYNYLAISQALARFENPFAAGKRLPGYPLLLVPTLTSGLFDDQFVMRSIQIISSMGAVIALVALARSLGLSWMVAGAAAAMTIFQKDYFWTSTRPEPYALYTALLIASLWLFVRIYQSAPRYFQYLFGIALGYSAMVRQEGFVLAVLLGAYSLAYELYAYKKHKQWQKPAKRIASMYLPALLIVLPFFMHNVSEYGTPFYTPYLEGERLQIVDSFHAFKDALAATWGVLGSMWKPMWDQLERLDFTTMPFIASVIGLWAWYALVRAKKPPVAIWALSILLWGAWVALVLGAVYAKPFVTGNIPIMGAAFLLASIPIFLLETRFAGVVILLALVSQIGIATWFHPFPKHYEQSYPLIILMVATAMLARVPNKRMVSIAALSTAVLPFLLTASFLAQKINAAIDSQNEDTALDSVTYRAARYARDLPKPIGFDQAYLPARLYFDPEAKYFPAEENPSPEMEQQWLRDNPVKTLVVTNANNILKNIDPSWKEIKTFKAASHDEKIIEATIYELPHL